MNHIVEETNYGPDIRFRDWEVERGECKAPGGTALILGGADTMTTYAVYPIGGGGDVEQALAFNVERFAPGASFTVQFNDNAWHHVEDDGFTCAFDERNLTARLGGDELHRGPHAGLERTTEHTLRLVTLGREYELTYNGAVVAAGSVAPGVKVNEGTMRIHQCACDLRLLSYTENFVRHPGEPPRWTRAEPLYEETFTDDSLRDNWFVNRAEDGPRGAVGDVTRRDGGFVVGHRCVMYSRRRFEGPLAVEAVVTPQPTDDYSAGVTDVIFLWNIDFDGGFIDFLRARDEATAPRTDLLNEFKDTPYYWIDFGGTDNRTTRLRRAPNRRLLRQFNDRPRLLKRDTTYRLTMVQNGRFVEFWVDGEPFMRLVDAEPVGGGHLAIRAFCAGLAVHELTVWRIAP